MCCVTVRILLASGYSKPLDSARSRSSHRNSSSLIDSLGKCIVNVVGNVQMEVICMSWKVPILML
jgi:hypothetical protein